LANIARLLTDKNSHLSKKRNQDFSLKAKGKRYNKIKREFVRMITDKSNLRPNIIIEKSCPMLKSEK